MEKSLSYYNNYENFDCDLFHNSLSEDGSNTDFAIQDYSRERYQREAYSTWYNFYEAKSDENKVRNYVNGTLTCFCDDEYQTNGLKIYSKDYSANGLESGDGDGDSAQICRSFLIYEKFSRWYFWLTSITVIIYNFLFPLITRPVFSIVGFHLRTREAMLVSFTLFICLFIDTILLPFFIGANFVEY
jgi:hypothetical protein